jgi:hypothetical protein
MRKDQYIEKWGEARYKEELYKRSQRSRGIKPEPLKKIYSLSQRCSGPMPEVEGNHSKERLIDIRSQAANKEGMKMRKYLQGRWKKAFSTDCIVSVDTLINSKKGITNYRIDFTAYGFHDDMLKWLQEEIEAYGLSLKSYIPVGRKSSDLDLQK